MVNRGLLLLLGLAAALIGAAPSAIAAEPALCAPAYGALAKGESLPGTSPAFQSVRKQLASRFRGVDLTWQEGKKRKAKLEKFFQELQQLKEADKALLREELKAAYPVLDEAPLLARIGLNEEAGWLKFFEASLEPTEKPLMIGELRPLVETIPEPTKAKLLAEVGRRYPTAGKMPEGERNAKFYPKRLLDGWLRMLLKGEDTFAAALAETNEPLKAYQKYFDQVNASVVPHIPNAKAAGYGRLAARDLLGIAEQIQKYLHDPLVKKHLYMNFRDDNGFVRPPRVRIFGSTVKGTGKLGSDLDLGYAEIQHHFVNGGERMGEKVPGLADALTNYLKVARPDLDLNFTGNAHFMGSVDEILTALEPFMIEISPDKIELLVYPRQIEARIVPFRGKKPIYQAPAPTRYLLK